MMKTISCKLFAPLGIICFSCSSEGDSLKNDGADLPNIVIILADDLGYGDLSCYGATKVNTPNIDRLANEGMLFTDAYSPSSVCSPSRYGLLTGEYPMRHPMFSGGGVLGIYHPLSIDTAQTTIASLAKTKGYVTSVIGKWHIGLGDDPVTDYNGEVRPGPLEIGFDECFIEPGNLEGELFIEGHHVVGKDPDDPFYWELTEAGKGIENFRVGVFKQLMILRGGENARKAKTQECTPVFTKRAVDFIHRNSDQPFLLYFAPNNVHICNLPGNDFIGKSELGIYGDYLLELDWLVGEVLSALDSTGLKNNTLIIFTSDNGGAYYKPHNAEAYQRGHKINAGFIGQKTDIWQGGHRIPFIVRWPALVKPGTTSDALISLVDIPATLAEAIDVSLQENDAPDSHSFLYAMRGLSASEYGRKSLVFQSWQTSMLGLRMDSWVYIDGQGSDGVTLQNLPRWMTFADLGHTNTDITPEGEIRPDAPPGQLYDLKTDLLQSNNLYHNHPEKVEEMKIKLEKIKAAKNH